MEEHNYLCFCFHCADPFLLSSLQNEDFVLPDDEPKGILDMMNNGTVKNRLLSLMEEFHDLVYVEANELHFVRDKLIRQLKKNPTFESLVFTSFERGLKHAGLTVIASTHGGNRVKKWGLQSKKTKTLQSKPTKKKRSYLQWNDDDYQN